MESNSIATSNKMFLMALHTYTLQFDTNRYNIRECIGEKQGMDKTKAGTNKPRKSSNHNNKAKKKKKEKHVE